jgi:hypothetical protein
MYVRMSKPIREPCVTLFESVERYPVLSDEGIKVIMKIQELEKTVFAARANAGRLGHEVRLAEDAMRAAKDKAHHAKARMKLAKHEAKESRQAAKEAKRAFKEIQLAAEKAITKAALLEKTLQKARKPVLLAQTKAAKPKHASVGKRVSSKPVAAKSVVIKTAVAKSPASKPVRTLPDGPVGLEDSILEAAIPAVKSMLPKNPVVPPPRS